MQFCVMSQASATLFGRGDEADSVSHWEHTLIYVVGRMLFTCVEGQTIHFVSPLQLAFMYRMPRAAPTA